jgi:hypothetical protein
MEEYLNNAETNISQQEEKALYNKAKRRVRFKVHLMIFILTNLFLWLIFGFGSKLFTEEARRFVLHFVLFVSSAWGVVLIAHYLIIYKWGKSYVDKEFEKLRKEYKKYKEVQVNQ